MISNRLKNAFDETKSSGKRHSLLFRDGAVNVLGTCWSINDINIDVILLLYRRTQGWKTWCKQYESNTSNDWPIPDGRQPNEVHFLFLYKYEIHTKLNELNQFTSFVDTFCSQFRSLNLTSIYRADAETERRNGRMRSDVGTCNPFRFEWNSIQFMFVRLTCLLEYDNVMWMACEENLILFALDGVVEDGWSSYAWNAVADIDWRRVELESSPRNLEIDSGPIQRNWTVIAMDCRVTFHPFYFLPWNRLRWRHFIDHMILIPWKIIPALSVPWVIHFKHPKSLTVKFQAVISSLERNDALRIHQFSFC